MHLIGHRPAVPADAALRAEMRDWLLACMTPEAEALVDKV